MTKFVTNQVYDWARWFDGRVWLLEENVDYPPGHRHSVTKSGYRWAKRHGITVTMRHSPGGGLLVQRVIQPGEEVPEPDHDITETAPRFVLGDPMKHQADRPRWDERDEK